MNKDDKIDFRIKKKDKLRFKRAATRHGCRSVGEWLIKLGLEKIKNDNTKG